MLLLWSLKLLGGGNVVVAGRMLLPLEWKCTAIAAAALGHQQLLANANDSAAANKRIESTFATNIREHPFKANKTQENKTENATKDKKIQEKPQQHVNKSDPAVPLIKNLHSPNYSNCSTQRWNGG